MLFFVVGYYELKAAKSERLFISNSKGVVHAEYLEKGTTINPVSYQETLKRLDKKDQICNRATPETMFNELPPYGPDLASSDFCFRDLKHISRVQNSILTYDSNVKRRPFIDLS